jgi:hypothetical protein
MANETEQVYPICGAYYKVPDGRVCHVVQCGYGKVGYYFDDDNGFLECPVEETKDWEYQKIRDFPNANDPRLPYEFDLLWDIKYTSQLKAILAGEAYFDDELDELKDMMKTHNIQL